MTKQKIICKWAQQIKTYRQLALTETPGYKVIFLAKAKTLETCLSDFRAFLKETKNAKK